MYCLYKRGQSKDSHLSKIPVIVTTGQDSEESEVKALSLGANDVLLKPYKPVVIKHKLKNMIEFRETAALINSVEKDSLTGVYNKKFFFKKVVEIIHKNPDKNYDILFINIERFKLVNELFGVKTGDDLIKYLANLIQKVMGEYGICGRSESDKFMILMEHKFEYKNSYFNRFIKKVNEFPINLNVTIKIGIYQIDDRNTPINVMCDRAMLACQSIKGKYDKCFAYYDDNFRKSLLNEQTILNNMQTALSEKQFKVYYQAKCDLQTGRVIGAEALVRWIHPEKGFMSPGEFIPIFEKNGFITDLDYYVWRTTCYDINNWMKNGNTCVPISVNVSRADIYNPHLVDMLTGLIKEYELTASNVHLEITETAYTENSQQIIETVSKLKSLGFIIEMDDFGSGYSSLNMLAELPIDILKLDMKFIQSETAGKNNKSILEFVIMLAKHLDCKVVAEGVETLEQVNILRNMECNYAQGYYYSKPLPLEKFQEFLYKDMQKVF